ncbi:zinc metalloprotease [Nonomuraea guangzhouensis]|uniref:Zinc metalloprotease n=1 Tax=Nonomuraea guangzhouensis TaxID=1291555 RepID=A0ABW4GC36_9ACTN|nr:zinc metalloprotease [Nonomuraea guangzhouensis]
MARRATAVSLACLLAAGLTPPLRPAATAWAAADCPAARREADPRTAHSGASSGVGLRMAHDGASSAGGPDAARDGASSAAVSGLGDDPRSPGPREPKPRDVQQVLAELDQRLAGVTVPDAVTVPTWVHVLTDGVRRASDAAIKAQIDTLNAAYSGALGGAPSGVRFRLDGISVKQNATWFVDPIANERAMKTALRKGGPETLNLYIGQLGDLVLGYSAYPYWYNDSPALDGVVIDWRSLPGGTMVNYDRGYTAVHEIGHWLGLFHTFENGCASPGDGIADTPPEAKPTEGCPETKETCAELGGDPIHNFMDYAHDRCMWEFTPEQAKRMHQMWAVYRGRGLLAAP